MPFSLPPIIIFQIYLQHFINRSSILRMVHFIDSMGISKKESVHFAYNLQKDSNYLWTASKSQWTLYPINSHLLHKYLSTPWVKSYGPCPQRAKDHTVTQTQSEKTKVPTLNNNIHRVRVTLCTSKRLGKGWKRKLVAGRCVLEAASFKEEVKC